MKIIWLTWKDIDHPAAGGAEVVNEELAKRLVRDGHEVMFVVGGFPGGAAEERRHGFHIVRVGSRWSVYWKAYRYVTNHLRGTADLVIDEVNTIPFFAKFYATERNVLFVHQLCREIWFYQMFFPLSLIGYLLEPVYLRMLSDREVITVSESTCRDLARYGFDPQKIHIISEGIELEPIDDPDQAEKHEYPTILSLGAVRPMKRTLDIIHAFGHAKKQIPNLRLVVAGRFDGLYAQRVRRAIAALPDPQSVQCLDEVDAQTKLSLFRSAWVFCVASVKEGWGLVVTEANSQGTPAVVYNVDGLRDSVRHAKTGLVCRQNTSKYLAQQIVILLSDRTKYEEIKRNAWQWSKEITFDKSYADFKKILKI